MYLDRWIAKKYDVKVEIEQEENGRLGLQNIKVFEKDNAEYPIAIIKNTEKYNFDKESALWKINSTNHNEDITYTEKEVQQIIKKNELVEIPVTKRPKIR